MFTFIHGNIASSKYSVAATYQPSNIINIVTQHALRYEKQMIYYGSNLFIHIQQPYNKTSLVTIKFKKTVK